MTQQKFGRVAGVVFAIIAVLHGLRLLFRWGAVIGGWTVPLWVSGLAVAVAGGLAYAAFRAQ